MTEQDRALAPLNAVSASIDTLETYRTPQELAESLQAIGQAVERSLRQLLRADTTSPDDLRLSALSPDDLAADRVVQALLASRNISPQLGTMATNLFDAAQRAAENSVRAADADLAAATAAQLRDEITARRDRGAGNASATPHASPPPTVPSPPPPTVPPSPPPTVPPPSPSPAAAPVVPMEHAAYAGPNVRPHTAAEPPSHAAPPSHAVPPSHTTSRPPLVTPSFEEDAQEEPHAVRADRSRKRGALLPIALLAGLALAAWLVFRILFAPADPMERGIEAFEQRRWGIAEQSFRAAIGADEDDVTARLYLARVLRAQGRTKEAGETLNQARKIAPKDADVMRELGHVFIDLKQPKSAVSAYRQAQELDPANAANWVGLVRALRAAGDPTADEVLRNAPAEAKSALGQ